MKFKVTNEHGTLMSNREYSLEEIKASYWLDPYDLDIVQSVKITYCDGSEINVDRIEE